MPRYRATRDYSNDRLRVHEGDVVEMTAEQADQMERDSPGTFDPQDSVEMQRRERAKSGDAVLDELRAQTPTIDIDPEDKELEIPGEGNKFTPASGYPVDDTTRVRVVERAQNRQQQAPDAKRGEPTVHDQSADARVTDETAASAAADAALLEGGVLSEQAAKQSKESEKLNAEAEKRHEKAAAAAADKGKSK